MKRFRWVVLAAVAALVAFGAASVLARSTYSNHAIEASSFVSNGDTDKMAGYADNYGSGDWSWIGVGEYAKWTFGVSELQTLGPHHGNGGLGIRDLELRRPVDERVRW